MIIRHLLCIDASLKTSFFLTKKFVSLLNLSNVGRLKFENEISKEIKDTWIQQVDVSKFAECELFMLTFSKEKYGKNTLMTRLQQSKTALNDEDADSLFKMIMHVMKKVPVEVTVQEAYDELRRFKNKL